MNNKKRILFLDYARVFTAFLVVYGHLYPVSSSVRLYICAFHMPLFFLISGFLHSPRTSKDELNKYLRTLFIPTTFFFLIGVFFYIFLFHKTISTLLNSIFKGIIIYGSNVPGNTVLWFLFALMGCKCLMYIYLKYIRDKRILKIISLLLFIVLVVLFFYRKIPYSPFFIRNCLMAFPFYYLGFYTKGLYSKGIIKLPTRLICFLLAFLFAIISILITRVNGRVSMFGFTFGQVHFPLNAFLFYTNGVIGSLMIIYISILFRKHFVIITILAESLISILGFQELIISIIGYDGEHHNYLTSVFVAVLIMIGCAFLNKIIISLCPQLLGKKKMKSNLLFTLLFFLIISTSCGKNEEIENINNKDSNSLITDNRKSYSILGNSISTFQDYIPNGFKTFYPKPWFRDVHETWWMRIGELLDLKYLANASWSGSTVAGAAESCFTSDTRIKHLSSKGIPDYIFIAGGTNDFGNNKKLGDISDEESFNKSTFAGGYSLLLYKIKSMYPTSMVICLSIFPRKNGFDNKNNKGWTIREANNIIEKLAYKYEYKYINMDDCGLDENIDDLTYEGLHPNSIGMEAIALHISKQYNQIINTYE